MGTWHLNLTRVWIFFPVVRLRPAANWEDLPDLMLQPLTSLLSIGSSEAIEAPHAGSLCISADTRGS